MARFAGILVYYVSVASLIGWYHAIYAGDRYESFFNLWTLLERLLGISSAFLFLVVLFFASLYLTLRISYRTIFSKVRDSVPSLARVREVVLPVDDYEEDDAPVRKSKVDDVYKKKAEELERKIVELQKSKKEEVVSPPLHTPK